VFDWNDLRHFLEVARSGSMSAASRSLGVNQSTVQRRLAALEKAIGATLVERHHDGYRLTEQGQRLLDDASKVQEAIRALQRRISSLEGRALGQIKVTTLVTLGERIIKSGFLKCFNALHPEISVEMEMGQRIADLGKGEADVAIRGGVAASETR
jgi:molybdate transport repressor ModE-like protein